MPTSLASKMITGLFLAAFIPFLVISVEAQTTAGATPKPERLTSISEVADVKPADIYFQELQSLIERYGISGFTTNKRFDGAAPLSRPVLELLVGESRGVLTQLSSAYKIPTTEVNKAFPATCTLDRKAVTFTEARIAEYLECSFGAGSVASKQPTTAIITRGRFVVFLDAALSAAERKVNELYMKVEADSKAL